MELEACQDCSREAQLHVTQEGERTVCAECLDVGYELDGAPLAGYAFDGCRPRLFEWLSAKVTIQICDDNGDDIWAWKATAEDVDGIVQARAEGFVTSDLPWDIEDLLCTSWDVATDVNTAGHLLKQWYESLDEDESLDLDLSIARIAYTQILSVEPDYRGNRVGLAFADWIRKAIGAQLGVGLIYPMQHSPRDGSDPDYARGFPVADLEQDKRRLTAHYASGDRVIYSVGENSLSIRLPL